MGQQIRTETAAGQERKYPPQPLGKLYPIKSDEQTGGNDHHTQVAEAPGHRLGEIAVCRKDGHGAHDQRTGKCCQKTKDGLDLRLDAANDHTQNIIRNGVEIDKEGRDYRPGSQTGQR